MYVAVPISTRLGELFPYYRPHIRDPRMLWGTRPMAMILGRLKVSAADLMTVRLVPIDPPRPRPAELAPTIV
jgi:hypothetical protein